MSTERDTLVRITYPDQVSWLTVAERFRSWIIGGLWVLVTIVLLFVLQRMLSPPPRRAARRIGSPCSRSRPPIARSAIFWSPATSSRCRNSTRPCALAETWHVRLGDAILSRNWIEPGGLLSGASPTTTICRSSI